MNKTITVLLMAACCTGCVMPFPHRRVHSYGVEGRVVNASTLAPVAGAVVKSDDQKTRATRSDNNGGFKLPPAYGWHGAYVFGPVSLSLLPGWDMTAPLTTIDVSATGYQRATLRITDMEMRGEGRYLKAGDVRLKPLMTETNGPSALTKPPSP